MRDPKTIEETVAKALESHCAFFGVSSILEALGLRRLAAQAGYRYERGEDTDA